MKKRQLLYVTAELAPYAREGGLGEIGRDFSKSLAEYGDYEVSRVMPCYKSAGADLCYRMDYPVEIGQGFDTCVVKTEASGDIQTYFITCDRYFYRDQIYGYEDDGLRFFFFCKAVLELIRRLPYLPELVHVNDWHTGMLPLLLKKEFPKIKTVYTVHNISYQGSIPASCPAVKLTAAEQYFLGGPEGLNFMKAGILYADLLTTVSAGYCEELMQPELGCGMTPLLKQRKHPMVGISHGIDVRDYDPEAGGQVEYPYDRDGWELKKRNRGSLRQHYSLPEDDRPLAAMITRLEDSEGIDALLNVMSFLDFSRIQLMILGTGGSASSYYQELLKGITAGYSGSVAVDCQYSPDKAKRIYAGADIYLMPFRHEPCSLGPLYAMRYGAVPVVYPAGGLKDFANNGFSVREQSGQALKEALSRVLEAYGTSAWSGYVKNCMDYDASWQRSIREYGKYYEELFSDPACTQDSRG
ncbi:starch synthase [Anaerotaenia torta]|uniref:glycogen synthase n=1 Tax=Anaerotaenia torta TaxID=433293 RepID=UPI003D246F49